MHTIELTAYLTEDLHEFWIAELAELDFDTFVPADDCVKAYGPASSWDATKREILQAWLLDRGIDTPLQERLFEPKDWNQQWENAIQPIAVGSFLIRPTWTETPAAYADHTLIQIDPKMSFGTGYHESTRLVLRFLPRVIQTGDVILDAGSGTGVLAIAAIKLGAASALAFDIDEWAQDNAVENFELNAVQDKISFREGGLEVISEDNFDVILANINRHVLETYLPAFTQKVKQKGHIILAGLLQTDRARMLTQAEPLGLTLVQEATEGEWWSVVLQRD